ncbi:hypothetical protein K445DRAFT_363576 [Daldinia sp. EC12]|nr:hypothetical protein K445DRAFT_363576 [Daldinia sp. EC12]
MPPIKKVVVFGGLGSFATPIASALVKAQFDVLVIVRPECTSNFPPNVPVARVDYTVVRLKPVLWGADAVVSVIGSAGLSVQNTLIDAAAAAGVKRFILDNFGWVPDSTELTEFKCLGSSKRITLEHVENVAQANPKFTFTGVAIGFPIDWSLKCFPSMGFDFRKHSAIIYDDGAEDFTGTTLEGIGQAVVGVLQNPEKTENQFLKVRSIRTNQNELLAAFQSVTGKTWEVKYSTTEEVLKRAKERRKKGIKEWMLDVLIYYLYEPGKARCFIASDEEPALDLLEIRQETAHEIASKVLESVKVMPERKWAMR